MAAPPATVLPDGTAIAREANDADKPVLILVYGHDDEVLLENVHLVGVDG